MKRSVLPAAVGLAAIVALSACGSSSSGSSSSGASSATSSSSDSTAAASSAPAGSASAAATGNPGSSVTLTEAGSSLIYPYLQTIQSPLQSAYSNISLQPAPGGSGKGIADAIAGTTVLGGSDAYLSSGQQSQNPDMLNVPVVISSQAINYNLKGVKNLKLTGAVLAQMYEGKITTWDDPAIKKLNPGANLPSEKVVPVRRVDASGDTFIFTSFLSATDDTWKNGPSLGTTVTWPAVGNELTASGNPGMVQTCSQTPGCIAYVGVSVQDAATKAGLGQAELQNKDVNFVLPTTDNVSAAVAAGAGSIPDNLAEPLIYEPGAKSYPIVNFEYLVVNKKQKSADLAMAVRTFLTWTMSKSGGSQAQYLDKVSFVAIPDSVKPKIEQAISQIQG